MPARSPSPAAPSRTSPSRSPAFAVHADARLSDFEQVGIDELTSVNEFFETAARGEPWARPRLASIRAPARVRGRGDGRRAAGTAGLGGSLLFQHRESGWTAGGILS